MRAPIRRGWPAIAMSIACALSGCAGIQHGGTLPEYQNRMLATELASGTRRLEIESAYDKTLKGWLEDHGKPDYLYVEGARTVHLIYLEQDRLVTFQRPFYTAYSSGPTPAPIPDAMRTLIRDVGGVDKTQPPAASQAAAETTGTCFAISATGTLVTASHLVRGASVVRARLSDGRVVSATVDRASALTGLAILKTDARTPEYLSPAPPGALASGQPIFSVGFPVSQLLAAEVKLSEGAITALSGPAGDAAFLQMSVPVQPGNSGAPLVTETGELAGVVLSTAQAAQLFAAAGALQANASWGVRSEYVTALAGAIAAREPTETRSAAIERTRKAVCLVEAATS